jgi:hypothetical protein
MVTWNSPVMFDLHRFIVYSSTLVRSARIEHPEAASLPTRPADRLTVQLFFAFA